MPNFQAYATKKSTPSRKARKTERVKVYLANKAQSGRKKKPEEKED